MLRDEFGRTLSDKDVHVLDPFTGTGVFLVRLIQSTLLRDADLERKYREELHANELILLAYYIAAIHIEEAFHGRRGRESAYEPFSGIVLTDTFNLHTERTSFPREWLPDNSERAERQQKLPIQVIVGNPPWSAGQKSSADDNPNVDYPELEQRVSETYALRSNSTNKNSLYDTYKMAIRWASDRIGDQGIVALVTNGSWIDGIVDSGVRVCLAEEFSSIHVLNLRGNQRTQGERSRREGGKIFGQGSRAPVAITILVKNPNAGHEGCRILYRDIGDYLKREEKLAILSKAGSISGITDWQTITPDAHNDWISQRSSAFQTLYPMGSKEVKRGKMDEAIFKLFSNGYYTGKDPYIYNFSRMDCVKQGNLITGDYRAAMDELKNQPDLSTERVINKHSANCKWDATLKSRLESGVIVTFSSDHVREVAYRPFVCTYCYADDNLSKRPAIRALMFPEETSENHVICVPGVGSTKPFSVLMVDTMPDLHFMAFGQCFPRYRYEQPGDAQEELPGFEPALEKIDNITDTALRAFRVHYNDNTITKDAIFDYVYGILHTPAYKERYANDLAKEMPRVSMAPDFHAFAKAGNVLAKLHLGYETCQEYPLSLVFGKDGKPRPEHFRIGQRAMRYANDERSDLIVNEHVSLGGIPTKAHEYQVNGRTPLEWFIDRYKISQDNESGIVNDPNAWFDDPKELIAAIQRIVHVSVETARIVDDLPQPFDLVDGSL